MGWHWRLALETYILRNQLFNPLPLLIYKINEFVKSHSLHRNKKNHSNFNTSQALKSSTSTANTHNNLDSRDSICKSTQDSKQNEAETLSKLCDSSKNILNENQINPYLLS